MGETCKNYLLKLHRLARRLGLPEDVEIWLKAEWANPGGSVKDRPALSIVRNALSTVCDAAAIEAAGIDPGARAETVAVPAFVALANRLAAARTQAVAN